MEKTLGYILSQLRDNEIAIKVLSKALKKQAKISRNAAVANLFVSFYMLLNETRWNMQKEINKELRKELNALKQTKGE